MRKRCLDFVCCPECRGSLEITSGEEKGGYITQGTLKCASCGRVYPVEDGIPRLLPMSEIGEWADKTRDSFSWEWLRYPGAMPEDRPVFLDEIQLDPAAFNARLVLDAGCGMGRYSMVALSLGAEVVAVDFSESLRRMVPVAEKEPGLHLVQGNLIKPPLKDGIFDIAYSHGVLHHTAAPYDAFRAVAKKVKSGGLLSVWLYGKAGKWSDFKTNPLRRDRQWLSKYRFAVWMVVGLRHIISETVRFFTTRMPAGLVHALCYPITALGAVPGLKYLTFSVHPDFKIRFYENFDWISPPYQTHHTKEELSGWFKDAGYSAEKVLPHGFVPKVGILGRKI